MSIICPRCEKPKPAIAFSKDHCRRNGRSGWCKKCMHKTSQKYLKSKARQSREARIALRIEVLTHYSGGKKPFCACCKIQILEFLGIDHIKGGGRKHKQKVRHLYHWLKKKGFPKGFRVLCHNCNQSRGAYGYCPHDSK